jgi:hypothetical protein
VNSSLQQLLHADFGHMLSKNLSARLRGTFIRLLRTLTIIRRASRRKASYFIFARAFAD